MSAPAAPPKTLPVSMAGTLKSFSKCFQQKRMVGEHAGMVGDPRCEHPKCPGHMPSRALKQPPTSLPCTRERSALERSKAPFHAAGPPATAVLSCMRTAPPVTPTAVTSR
eukprot:4204745-Prymnesium_polylepis.1